MRKADREITDLKDIYDVLERCPVIRVGIKNEPYPYVVPLSFGCELQEGKISVYFHGAKEGLKHELLSKDPHVCVEADLFHGYVELGHGITTDYESVIGFGTAEIVEGSDAVHGLQLLLDHCGSPDEDAEGCVRMGRTRVYRITLDEVYGKRRFPKE